MNKLIPAVVVAAAFALPAISFAQSADQGLSRAQVRAQLVQLEQTGYNPANNQINYPQDLQAAQKVAASDTSGYGAPTAGTTAAGAAMHSERPVLVAPQQSVYFGR